MQRTRFSKVPSHITQFLNRYAVDYLLSGIADVAEEMGVLLSMDQSVMDLTFMISRAHNLREERKKQSERQAQAQR